MEPPALVFGDVITLAVSNYQGWVSNDGNTNVFAVDSAHVTSAFGHSRTYYVEKGKANFMRLAHNWTGPLWHRLCRCLGLFGSHVFATEQENSNFEGQGFMFIL